jgi:arsenate reductase
MAEGFARTYGSDVLEPASAGLAPAVGVAEPTRKVMLEKNIDISEQFPKGLDEVDLPRFDLVVNMSGYPLAGPLSATLREWSVRDPIGEKEQVYRQVADQIEGLVMQLILELRRGPKV